MEVIIIFHGEEDNLLNFLAKEDREKSLRSLRKINDFLDTIHNLMVLIVKEEKTLE